MQTTWKEVYILIKDWLDNGEEAFEDKYAEYLYLMKKEDDPDFKKVLDIILNIMDLLRERL